jgi:hypothetical protein
VGTAFGKVYKNGVAVGTERTAITTHSENFTVAIGDSIQVYAKQTAGGSETTKISALLVTTNDPYIVREASGL